MGIVREATQGKGSQAEGNLISRKHWAQAASSIFWLWAEVSSCTPHGSDTTSCPDGTPHPGLSLTILLPVQLLSIPEQPLGTWY